jgi:hypothetical protein
MSWAPAAMTWLVTSNRYWNPVLPVMQVDRGLDERVAGDAKDRDRGLLNVGDDAFGTHLHHRVQARLDQAPGLLGPGPASPYTKIAKTSPHPGSVTQPVSAPMSRSRVFALQSSR